MPALRILFTSQPASGHLQPLVSIAHAARSRGHEVRVASCTRLAGQIRAFGLDPMPLDYDFAPETVPLLPPGYMRLGFADAAEALAGVAPAVTRLFAGRAAISTARELLAKLPPWQPDVIVREMDEFGGYLAAEVLGIPHVPVLSYGGVANSTGQRLGPLLGEARTELGLPPDPGGDRLYQYLTVSFLPEEFADEERILPGTRCYRHPMTERLRERLPAWLADGDHALPFVFAGFGTVVYDLPGVRDFLQAVIAALGGTPCRAVVAVGSGRATDGYHVPPNVRLTDFVAQPMLLEGCDLFVTHAGLNSVKDALRLAVPMVSVPVLPDQRANAAHSERAGLSRTIRPADAAAESLSQACAEVLGTPSYRVCARRMQRCVHRLPSLDDLIDDLEKVAGGRQFGQPGLRRTSDCESAG